MTGYQHYGDIGTQQESFIVALKGTVLGSFAQESLVATSFISVRPSVRVRAVCCGLIWKTFMKVFVEKIQILLKSGNIIGHFT